MQGPSSVRRRRKSTIRSVMAASLLAPRGAETDRKGCGDRSSFARAVERASGERSWPTATGRTVDPRENADRRRADLMLRRWLDTPRPEPFREKPSIGRESPIRTPGKKDKPLRYADLWRVDRDEKARSVVALSRVPRLRRGSPVRLRLPVGTDGLSASCPNPANRHTTTGTCEIGQGTDRAKQPSRTSVFCALFRRREARASFGKAWRIASLAALACDAPVRPLG
jgi:hypothetical protein